METRDPEIEVEIEEVVAEADYRRDADAREEVVEPEERHEERDRARDERRAAHGEEDEECVAVVDRALRTPEYVPAGEDVVQGDGDGEAERGREPVGHAEVFRHGPDKRQVEEEGRAAHEEVSEESPQGTPVGRPHNPHDSPENGRWYTAPTMTDAAPALLVRDLRKTYAKDGKKAGTEALKGVSLSIPKGEFYGLLGPNGAGKSTLIGIVSGLVTKTEGTVEIAGIDASAHPDQAKAKVGLVPQEFNFNIFEKVVDIVVDQAGYYGIPRNEAAERAETVLKDLGLWEKKDAKAQALSGGMKRRLMIARALVHEPEILLLDEPTAGVDVELRRGMWDFLRALSAKGTTIVLTTHYLEEAEMLCSRIGIINGGQVIEEGSVKSLLTKLNYVTLLLDTVEPVTPAQVALMRDLAVEMQDENTVKLTLKPGETVNDSIRLMTKIGISISNIRNSGSRLEEVFVNLIGKQ